MLEHSDKFMMSVIGLSNTSRNAFRSVVGRWVKITGFTWRRRDYFAHFSDCDWFKHCELRIHFWKVSIYKVWSKTCETGMDMANFVF